MLKALCALFFFAPLREKFPIVPPFIISHYFAEENAKSEYLTKQK